MKTTVNLFPCLCLNSSLLARSASREREKRDSLSRQPVKSSNLNSFKLHIAHLPLTISEEYVRTHFER